MGLPFLEEAEIISKNRNFPESCPDEWKGISQLLWIGPPRNRMKCLFAGRDLIGVADTGSDLNMMSLECAKREGFDIDQRDSARRLIRLGDGSEAETVGQVYVYNLGFDWSQPETEKRDTSPSSPKDSPSNDTPSGASEEHNYEAFHVFPGLPSDLIFGRDLLERLDAFNLCPDLVSEHPKKRKRLDGVPVSELNILINVRRSIFSFRKRRKNNAGDPVPLDDMETHNDDWHAELGRRSREEDRIRSLPQREQERARRAERRQVENWDRLHARCLHCHPT